MEVKLKEIEMKQTKVQETFGQTKEKEELTEKVRLLEQEKLALMDQLRDVDSNKSTEIAELKTNLASLQNALKIICMKK